MPEELLGQSFNIIVTFAWVVFPILIIVILRDFWMVRVVSNYVNGLEWVVLEIDIPKLNLKSLKSMEQVFVSLHGTYSFGIKKRDKFLKGKVEDWMSLEIAGFGKSIHFYVRTQKHYRNLVEAAFFSQYPDAEIREVDDYTKMMPSILPNDEYDIFGTDFVLANDDAYPIKTYPDFQVDVKDEEKNIDPIATLAEAISALKNDEIVWIQVLISPTGIEWTKGAEDILEEISGRKQKTEKRTIRAGIGEFLQNLLVAPARVPEWSSGVDESAETVRPIPGKQDVAKLIQKKMGQIPFNTTIRFIYIDKKDEFTTENISAVFSSLRQFSAPSSNSLKPNEKTMTKDKAVSRFPWRRKKMLAIRKRQLYRSYLERAMPHDIHFPYSLKLKSSILGAEELATIFHPPTITVRAPKLQQLESRKGEPPVDLPIA